MRKNTWVFYFFIIIFTAILSFNMVWRFTPIRSEIKAALEDRLKPYIGETFTVSDFSLGFGYISFYNIAAASADKSFQLNLDEIQIGYSIHKLPLNKFDPLKVIESITFKNPKLIILTARQSAINGNDNDSLDVTVILSGFQRLAEVDRVLINNGQILWGKKLKDLTKLVSELDGYLIVNPETSIRLNLKGRLFESVSKDLSLIGTVNLIEKNWDIEAIIEESFLKESLPFLSSNKFSMKTAKIQGKLAVSCPSFNIQRVDIKGKLNVKNFEALLFDQKLQTDEFQIELKGQDMMLSPVSGIGEDGRFTLTGNLGKIFQPGLYFSINFDNYSVKYISKSAPILKLLNEGKLQGNLKIEGPISQIVIKGNLYASQLNYSIVPFYRSSLNFTYRDKIWRFHDIETYSIGMSHQGKGLINFAELKMDFNFSSHRSIEDDALPLFDALNRTEMRYYTTVTGDFRTLTFAGKISSAFQRKSDSLLVKYFDYELIDDHITIQSNETASNGFKIYSEISNLWTEPTFDILEIDNLPLYLLTTFESLQWLDKHFSCDCYFSGPVNFPTAKINFTNRKSKETSFTFVGNAINLIKPELKFRGKFTFQTRPKLIKGNFILEDQPNRLKLNIDAPSLLNGELVLDRGENAPIEGKIELIRSPLAQYIAGFPKIKQALQEGNIFGNIDISGTARNPEIRFKLIAENFIINQNGYYSAMFGGYYLNDSLKFQKANILYNNHPIINTQFEWSILQDSLLANFSGSKIESNFIASTLFNNPKLIQGEFSYDVALAGPLNHPKINGTVFMPEGSFKDKLFENLVIEFQDSISPQGSLSQINSHIFKISKFAYADKKDYNVDVSGIIPISAETPWDITLNAQGNILAELPNLLDYFQNPSSIGELSLKIGGNRENPKFDAGYLNILNGSLEFESVIPPLTNLKAEVELKEGTQFIHIKNLEGLIADRSAKIYNSPKVVVAADSLQSWYFEDFGLNFGILVLETDERGIPLSIPGLMNPGDIGFFATRSGTENEKFYFSGPVEKPKARGEVKLIESRVTFPFLVTEKNLSDQESDRVLDFLMNIDWNVKAVAGIGNRYFVDIPAVIGHAYLDLNIDNVSEGLIFSGRLNDESFKVEGSVESTRGRVEYLDMNFRVERFGAIFNKFEIFPEVYGKAWTTVRDSTNFPRDIYLVLYAIDPETNREISRGRWEDFRFKLVSSDPTIGETQENVLAYLGYSVDNISNKAGDIGIQLTEDLLIRPLIRPLERKMERGLGLDYVRLSLQFTSNLFYYGFQSRWKFLQNPNYIGRNIDSGFDPALLVLQSSQITLGKYLIQNLYFTYSGQLVSVYDESKLGLNQTFGLEYRLLQNLLLEFEYDRFFLDSRFYTPSTLQDFRIRLKHSFNF